MKKVLVVEDNQDLLNILQKRLSDAGFEIDTVEDGHKLLAYMRSAQAPDVVVLDLMLPERSGIDLLYSLKSKWPQTKVFIFSAYPEYKDKPLFEDYICGFYNKSDGTAKLIEAIKREL